MPTRLVDGAPPRLSSACCWRYLNAQRDRFPDSRSMHCCIHRCFLLCWCALLSAGIAAPAADRVIISEFVASNSNGLRDEDGDYADWIELFNAGTNTVDL